MAKLKSIKVSAPPGVPSILWIGRSGRYYRTVVAAKIDKATTAVQVASTGTQTATTMATSTTTTATGSNTIYYVIAAIIAALIIIKILK